MCSAGSSGAFFYITPDQVFVIKTLAHSEFTLLESMLPSYLPYMASQPKSFITRFFGLYSLMLYVPPYQL